MSGPGGRVFVVWSGQEHEGPRGTLPLESPQDLLVVLSCATRTVNFLIFYVQVNVKSSPF